MNNVMENILNRRSIRSFSQNQITDGELEAVLDAGLNAPSSRNLQPWHFTVVQNKELLDNVVKDNREFVASNPELAKVAPWLNAPNYNNFYNAPTVIFISGQSDNFWHVCDCALAMENMSLAASSISLGSCIIASTRFLFQSPKASEYMEKLGIPAGYTPLYALSVGYPQGEQSAKPSRKKDAVNFVR